MISVSDDYKELVKSNIRPKCEPIIKVSGKDNNENETEIIWKASNIKDLKYKRGIDPVGRELPYMELTWTEIYTGELNAQSYPEKYNNIIKYMAVELSFVQDLEFGSQEKLATWDALYDDSITWGDLSTNRVTWNSIKDFLNRETESIPKQEIITVPKMFLTAKPTISGQTITWVARDLLYFLDEKQIKNFSGGSETGISASAPIKYFLANSRATFLNSPHIIYDINESIEELKWFQGNNLDKQIIFDGATKDLIVNYAKLYQYYFDFQDNILICKNYSECVERPIYDAIEISKNVMYQNPKIKGGTDISVYNFRNYVAIEDEEREYYVSSQEHQFTDDLVGKKWQFKGYGKLVQTYNGVYSGINYAVGIISATDTINVIPIEWVAFENSITNLAIGENFVEDNPLNPYDDRNQARFIFLRKYFNSNCDTMEFECLPNFSLETSDLIEVDTNLFENDIEIKKKAMIISLELTYNGAFREKIIAHEVYDI